jgi:uncharacterized membrane protein
MNRKELDGLVAHYRLTPPQVERALALAHARPSPQETLNFATRALVLAGVLSLAAGVVFLIAANWSELRVFGRFVMVEALLLISLVLAFLRPPPHPIGRHALLGGFVLAGVLLALVGQTYQTGANVYELFLLWAVLGLPIVLAGQWSILWMAWVLVLNTALGLFVTARPDVGGPLWFLSGMASRSSVPLLIATLTNVALWALAEYLHARVRNVAHQVPGPLRSLILACAIAFATWAGIRAIASFSGPRLTDWWSILWVVALLAGVGIYALRRRVDVLPLALIAASTIVLVMVAIIHSTTAGDSYGRTETMALMVTAWLIVSSGIAVRVLMSLLRNWRQPEEGP